MCLPKDMPREAVHQMLRGGYDKVYEAGCHTTGGPSTFVEEAMYGLAVTGFLHPGTIPHHCRSQTGEVHTCTKALGNASSTPWPSS